MKKLIIPCILFLAFWAIRPLFHAGFFPVHDNAQVARVFEMSKELGEGMFPVRWIPDLGFNYGYPLFNFYGPLAYYIGAVVHSWGIDVVSSTKIMIAMGILFAGVSMYLLASEFWGVLGGILSAVLYIYAPYHALDIYVRGDIAEMWAYAFVPLGFYGLWKSFVSHKWSNICIGAFGFAGVICSHNLTAMMFAPFLIVAAMVLVYLQRQKGWRYALYPCFVIILGILLGSSFWLPVFFEIQYTNVFSQIGGGFTIQDHFICPSQLWYSPWGFGGSTKGCIDGISFMLGKAHLFFFVLSGSIGMILSRKKKIRWIIIVSILGSLFSLFLTLDWSIFIWNAIKPMAFFQFPWRFLLMFYVFSSFVSGSVVWFIKKYISNRVWVLLFTIVSIAVVISLNSKLLAPKEYLNEPLSYFEDTKVIGWDISEPSNEFMPPGFAKPKNKQELPNQIFETQDQATIQEIRNTNIVHAAIISGPKPVRLHINIAYFPVWHATIDGHETSLYQSPKGMDILMPQGKHIARVFYQETSVEHYSDLLSIVGISILVLGIIQSKTHEKKKR